MLISYTDNRFAEDYIPTVFDNYSANVMVDGGMVVHIDLWDTAGQEDYDGLRPLSYPSSDVFILCFSLLSRTSLLNAASKWAPELRAYDKRNGSRTPIILIGTKSDVRNNPLLMAAETQTAVGGVSGMANSSTSQIVSYEEGLATSQKIGCDAYVECSAMTQDGLKLAFDEAIKVALRKKISDRQGNKKDGQCAAACSIM